MEAEYRADPEGRFILVVRDDSDRLLGSITIADLEPGQEVYLDLEAGHEM